MRDTSVVLTKSGLREKVWWPDRTGRKVFFVDVGWLVASLFTVQHRWPPKEYCQEEKAFCQG